MLPMMKIIDQSLAKPFWTFFPILTLQNSCLVKSSHYLSIHSHAYIQTTTHTMRKKECPDPCYHSEDHSSQMSTRNSMAISPRCSSELTPASQLIPFLQGQPAHSVKSPLPCTLLVGLPMSFLPFRLFFGSSLLVHPLH